MKNFAGIVVLAIIVVLTARAETTETRRLSSERVREPIVIDGILSESAWHRQGWTDFTQKRPTEGAAPTHRTEVWVAYNDEALYVAARMFDSAPDSIMNVLGRRDYDVTADWFTVYVDPYRDKRTGNYFSVSAAGSMQDGTLSNDEWNDNSWDGVWDVKTATDATGWTMEMRIPFSQFRFIEQSSYTWGINFARSIGRTTEQDFVVFTPTKGSGFVSRFIELVGIEGVKPPHQIELLPYITTRAEFLQHAPNDPFNNGTRLLPGIGADVKAALSSTLMFNGTINPDFGQVELDPAVVNLSDVESYYQEKRPFFIEGASTFEFGYGGASNFWGFNWSGPDFFYSRRIGRTPQGSIPFSASFIDAPVGTHILGAGKITGKVAGDWNFGMIQAVTKREFAQADTSGVRVRDIEIEPASYYGLARMQRSFNDGRQGLGFIGTLTQRFFNDQRLKDEINSGAVTGGVDGWTFLDEEKVYVVTAWAGASRVAGNRGRMIDLQNSSRHYFQRPDVSYLGVDSSATSMTGYATRLTLNKQKGSVMINAALGVISPGFDVNDMGFMWRSDVINAHVGGGYKWTDPTRYYQSAQLMTSVFESKDFGGTRLWAGWWMSGNIELTSFWNINAGMAYNPSSTDIHATRGGPAMLNPIGREFFGGISSDSRKEIVFNVHGDAYIGGSGKSYYAGVWMQYKPAPNINISIGPGLNYGFTAAQWINDWQNPVIDPLATATYGRRYLFADMEQRTLSTDIRLNWTFTPRLSLQLFMQPFISSADYRNFKEFLRPGSFDFRSFGSDGSTIAKNISQQGDLSYTLDPDGGGPASAVTISNPNFNYKSLRGNAVLRWEFQPGSVVYFVWTQTRSDSETLGNFEFRHSLGRLVDSRPDNIFMIKFSYWINA
ncbi:MAG TPA: DUF5916 domain-containing protein [Bacteroidota bacterium]|nr:DUF5916 domain-containing protein [Bacteroidota bacterium]